MLENRNDQYVFDECDCSNDSVSDLCVSGNVWWS